ncbi:DNA-directed RNA polymerases I and III subunit RPAC1 isoform X1 [Bacillus rossius redtenbacheri]|uniref:DNA-directed RNA polymerases I and III subunit RPAC1 isoform X1 n=1 Tax=Bacillus rossius redtenbacheri TaxID=93214 RepID=UPI002FDF0430
MDAINEGKSRIVLTEYSVLNTSSSDYPGTYGPGGYWSHENFKKKLKINVVKHNATEMEFDIIGVHEAIANAFRRLLLSEVPSMAIEKVFVYNNTSIIQDEVLAHRLGLIPLKADARRFEYRQKDDEDGTEQDTLEFELKIKCTKNPNAPKDSKNPDDIYKNANVYTKHMRWLPRGDQGSMFKAGDVGPVHGDILVAKMRPGHELDLKLHAVKGVGKDHAKFSPVCTAYYRLLPEITLTREVSGEQAERLQTCFSPGVIGLEERNGRKVAKVINARYDTCSRNVFRYDDLKDSAKLTRVKDHFIFTIESVGAIPPDVLFVEAVKILKNKCRTFLEELNKNI